MPQKVEYIVEVTRQGSGAAEAAQQLTQVGKAAAAVNNATKTTSTGLQDFEKTTKIATTSLKALGTTAVLIGGSEFPRLGMGIIAVKEALHAMRAANVAVVSSLATTSAGIAGIIAALTSAVFAWQAYKAEQLEKSTAEALHEQTKRFTEDLRGQLTQLNEAGQITDKTFTQLSRSLNSAGGLQEVRDFLKELDTGTASSALADLARAQAFTQAQTRNINPNLSRESEKLAIAIEYKDVVETTQALELMGLMTSKEATDARTEADIKRLNALTQLNAKLTDLQQVERGAAQEFASGLSAAIVQFASGAKSAEEAFKQFAATFLQNIAQMILQMLILRAIKTSFGLGFADGGQAISRAAFGGQFPITAANGVNGIKEVSTPTYFPRFNVLAGEAGREVMTVMARPRLMNIGGIAAQIGDVGPNRLAITNAGDLQRLGMGGGGATHVHISMDPNLRGDIMEQSANTAVHLVTRKMGERGPLSEKTRRLMNQ